MLEINRAEFAGNLGRDASTSTSEEGKFRAFFTVAANRTYKDKSGTKQKNTLWVPCVYFGPGAQAVAPYLVKGKGVWVEGRIQTRMRSDQEGNEREVWELVVNNLQLMPDKGANGGSYVSLDGEEAPSIDDLPAIDGDDVPF